MWLFLQFQASPSSTQASPISKASDPLNWYLWGSNQEVWIKHNIPPGDSNAWPAQVTVISTEFYELDLFHALANRIWLLLLPFLPFLALISDLLFFPFYLDRFLFYWSYTVSYRSIDQYNRLCWSLHFGWLLLKHPSPSPTWLSSGFSLGEFTHPFLPLSLVETVPTSLSRSGPEWLKAITLLFPPWARWLVPKWGLQQ